VKYLKSSYSIWCFSGLIGILFSFHLIGENSIEELVNIFESYHQNFPNEKVYLHLDKESYVLGETIWYAGYISDSQIHGAPVPSINLYVNLYDEKDSLVHQQILEIRNGKVSGDILISPLWKPGKYNLRAFSKYSLNYHEGYIFQQEVPIFNSYSNSSNKHQIVENLDVQFFPEAGDLIHGLRTKIAFKAVNSIGESQAVSGSIVNQNGDHKTIFASIKFGHGFFSILPVYGEQYQAIIDHKGVQYKFDLPEIKALGYQLDVDTRKWDTIQVKVNSTVEDGLEGALLFGHIRGNIFLTIDDFSKTTSFSYNTSDLPEGVSHFTLFDKNLNPVCERLVFILKEKSHHSIQFETAKESYINREKVKIKLSLKNNFSDQLVPEASVAVVDINSGSKDYNSLNIKNFFLLQSDIIGNIENPAYYFNEESGGRKLLIDLLMMTQGWRRFNWKNVISKVDPEILYFPERGFNIDGWISKKGKKDDKIKAEVFLNAMSADFIRQDLITEKNGMFSFNNLRLIDSTNILIQANKYDSKKRKKREQVGAYGDRNVDIHINEDFSTNFSDQYVLSPPDLEENELEKFLKLSKEMIYADSLYRNNWQIDLEGVTVTATRKQSYKKIKKSGMIYSNPETRIVLDSTDGIGHYSNVFEIIRGRVPGVEVKRDITSGEYAAYIRGGIISLSGSKTPAQILLDGFLVDNQMGNLIDAHNIDFIDVLKGLSSTSVFGASGAAGVIAIWTREPGVSTRRRKSFNGILNFNHPGYYQAREFYHPNYQASQLNNSKPDFRSTLYWNPDIQFDSLGHTSIEFYTCDNNSVYNIQIEGMTSEGNPFVGTHRFMVTGVE